jgi:tetratricopeptide (TPR) repeat protein
VIDPNQVIAISNKGTSLLGIGKDQEALEWLDRALELYIEKPLEVEVDRNQIFLLNNKAVTLVMQGKYQEALTGLT